jgi:hypothetical protein
MATPIALFSKGRGDFFEIFGSHMGEGETGYAFIVLQPRFPVYDTHTHAYSRLSHIVTEKETARGAITWGLVNPTQNRKVSKPRNGGIGWLQGGMCPFSKGVEIF